MNIYGLTDRGNVREINEDYISITCLKTGVTVAVVCDGMGGAAGGKIASEIGACTFMDTVVSCLSEEAMEKSKYDSRLVKSAIKKSVEAANKAILEKAREDLSLYGMGCTLNAVVFIESKARVYYANVGDSRLYMINKREIKQLSKDHSYVQMLVDNKEITRDEAWDHPSKNLITKALGIKDEIEPDISDKRISLKSETYFLLCSDGLHGLLHEDKLQQIALSPLSIAEKVFAYIRLANEAGGHDNISAILLCTQESEVNK